MNLFSPLIIKQLLAKYDATPQKRLGQNFLINPGVLAKIIQAGDLNKDDVILEIGPGLGTLTQALAQRAKKVITIEKDRKMIEILQDVIAADKIQNVKIIRDDVLKFDIGTLEIDWKLEIGNWKLIANLPYYIASPVIRKFLEEKNPPSLMILMVQKEVAQRICASPPNMSLLAVSVQFYAKPEILSYVSKGSFWPAPKVDSAILKITPYSQYPNVLRSQFFSILHTGFSAPRKQLAGNLAKSLAMERYIIEEQLKEAGIEPSRRAETLTIEEWIKLTVLLKNQSSCI